MNRRLTRSRNGMIGGVAAGLAEWLNADPALVRIAWALLVPLTGGAALLAYLVAWVVVPEAPRSPTVDVVDAAEATDPDADPTPAARQSSPIDEGRAALLVGGGLILLGLWFLVREYVPSIDWGFVWPLILVGVGVLILSGAARRR